MICSLRQYNRIIFCPQWAEIKLGLRECQSAFCYQWKHLEETLERTIAQRSVQCSQGHVDDRSQLQEGFVSINSSRSLVNFSETHC